MELKAWCMRCDKEFCGPDEGCPTCDKDRPDVTSARNWHPDAKRVVMVSAVVFLTIDDDEDGRTAAELVDSLQSALDHSTACEALGEALNCGVAFRVAETPEGGDE